MKTSGVFRYPDFAKPARHSSIFGVSMRHIVSIAVALVLATVLVGCGPHRSRIGVISGTITYRGQPVNDAELRLYPMGGDFHDTLTIGVGRDGTFRIADLPLGDYKIAVQGTEGGMQGDPAALKNAPPERRAEMEKKLAEMNTPPTIPFPNKYKDPKTSNLSCTITDKDQTLDLELKD
jgi:hypothetical protein